MISMAMGCMQAFSEMLASNEVFDADMHAVY